MNIFAIAQTFEEFFLFVPQGATGSKISRHCAFLVNTVVKYYHIAFIYLYFIAMKMIVSVLDVILLICTRKMLGEN